MGVVIATQGRLLERLLGRLIVRLLGWYLPHKVGGPGPTCSGSDSTGFAMAWRYSQMSGVTDGGAAAGVSCSDPPSVSEKLGAVSRVAPRSIVARGPTRGLGHPCIP